MTEDTTLFTFPITLADGKERAIRYSLAGIKRLSAKIEKLTSGTVSVLDAIDIVPVMILEGLAEKDLTVEQIEELVYMPMVPGLVAQIRKAIGERDSTENPPITQLQ